MELDDIKSFFLKNFTFLQKKSNKTIYIYAWFHLLHSLHYSSQLFPVISHLRCSVAVFLPASSLSRRVVQSNKQAEVTQNIEREPSQVVSDNLSMLHDTTFTFPFMPSISYVCQHACRDIILLACSILLSRTCLHSHYASMREYDEFQAPVTYHVQFLNSYLAYLTCSIVGRQFTSVHPKKCPINRCRCYCFFLKTFILTKVENIGKQNET